MRNCLPRLMNRSLPVLFVIASLVYVTFKWTKSYFGRHLDVEAMFFTLALPMGGADTNIVLSYVKVLAVALPLMLLLAYGYFRLLKRFSGEGPKPAHKIGYGFLLIAGFAYFIGAVYYLEHRKKLISFLLMPREQSAMFEEGYHPLEARDVYFQEKRNVVLIILESIEETYNDETLFGEKLMPSLAALRANNASFYGSRETRGADWTVGALSAYTLGLPLAFAKESTTANYFGEALAEFIPAASSILRIFEDKGYQISFFLGSEKGFAGQDKLVGSHTNNAAIYDLKYFEEKRARGEISYRPSNWGVPDSRLYAEARDFLQKNHDEPFFIIMQMVDTHIGDGNFNGPGERKWGDLRDCVAEADQMAASFITWLQEQSFYENTTIIVLGDHLLPLDNLGPVALPEDRRQREPYNVFINSAFKNITLRRNFAAFDLAPTILAAAGARWPGGRLGLGVSLLEADSQTLFEAKGQEYYEEEVRKKSSFYESLFHTPK